MNGAYDTESDATASRSLLRKIFRIMLQMIGGICVARAWFVGMVLAWHSSPFDGMMATFLTAFACFVAASLLEDRGRGDWPGP